ncbi:hypothetical protein DFQ14_102178 [Halopolyspora algeriensis]|uniref:Uncharacterized protein n=1 Tax=Halopolyspora algeriensis TaxID=1500506 RepID=A0A368VX40_9ACTN|nr:hypothetical protein [Halopolyspora algeriensis]RCW45877.1 hypothetical protein DFQ14_102178 [Halopolyspora algeriensis]TQM55291.1 hypothetical protein FHU43_0052 [Halopolyspora algeriensis]
MTDPPAIVWPVTDPDRPIPPGRLPDPGTPAGFRNHSAPPVVDGIGAFPEPTLPLLQRVLDGLRR